MKYIYEIFMLVALVMLAVNPTLGQSPGGNRGLETGTMVIGYQNGDVIHVEYIPADVRQATTVIFDNGTLNTAAHANADIFDALAVLYQFMNWLEISYINPPQPPTKKQAQTTECGDLSHFKGENCTSSSPGGWDPSAQAGTINWVGISGPNAGKTWTTKP